MSILKYIFQSLFFYRKKHMAVLLATVLATMVLTGALMVGESVSYSLNNMLKQRLGSIGYALRAADRMLSDDLVLSLGKELQSNVAGIIEVSGISINPVMDLRFPGSKVYGVDSSFWKFTDSEIENLKANEAYLSKNLAQRINVKPNDFILIRVNVPQVVALNTPFSQEENTSIGIRLKVKALLSDDAFGRFSMLSDQKSPYNVFVSKKYLSNKFDMLGKNNQLLIENSTKYNVQNLNRSIKKVWQLHDLGISLRQTQNNEFQLLSNQVFISNLLAESVYKSEFKIKPIFTYLVNEFSSGDRQTPYSFVSGVQTDDNIDLSDNEILINRWLAEDLRAKIGDSITFKYYVFGSFRKLEERQKAFIIKGIQPNQNSVFNKYLMPDFPGLADAGSCSEWDTGIPIDLDKIRKKDEDYWDEYKGTPKAIISFSTAHKLWQNEYGEQTAFKIIGDSTTQKKLETHLLTNLKPESFALNFVPVYRVGNASANNGVDFGELFLSLSFFVIVSSILLLAVIYLLNYSSRKKEVATLKAMGFRFKTILAIILSESAISIVVGAILGALLAVFYNHLLIKGLNSVWNDAVFTKAILPYRSWPAMLVGFIVGSILSFSTIYLILRKQLKQTVIQGISSKIEFTTSKSINRIAIGFSILFIMGLVYSFWNLTPSITLSLGFMFLVLALLWLNFVMNAIYKKSKAVLNQNRLIVKNIAATKGRTLLIIGLLAIGVYTVLVTGANRKTFIGTDDINASGTGGFNLWMETTLPILFDLNTGEGKAKLGMLSEPVLDSSAFVLFNRLEGDDASCLNLNQVQQPGILGVNPNDLSKYNAFSFAQLLQGIDPENPWDYLKVSTDSLIVPVYLDQTVIQWGLMKKVGDTLIVLNERGETLSLVIAGGLEASIFQGYMLMSQTLFRQHFPSKAGANIVLVKNAFADSGALKQILSNLFVDYGVELQATNNRLAQFNAVTNTYLNVFMLLGGLALIIGTIGLGIVIIRNIMERKAELATLQALGFNHKTIFSLVFKEYFLILILGLKIGFIAALLGMIPSFVSNAFTIPVSFLALVMLIILINGMVWIALPIYFSLKNNVIAALQME